MNKTAIITGGNRGIGYAIVKQLGTEGYNIVIASTSQCSDAQIEELKKLGIEFEYIYTDISSSKDRLNCVRGAVKKYGEIHVLVNNAGVAPLERKDILEMSEESFDRVIGINTKGTLFMSQVVANQMLKQDMCGKKRGTIINISSCSSVIPSTSRGEYCISKAGISMITKLFADRLAQECIYVYEVRPGIIETDMTKPVKEKYDQLIEEGVFSIARWGQPEDVAQAVSLFCSDKLLYTTGNYIDVDGGLHIQRL